MCRHVGVGGPGPALACDLLDFDYTLGDDAVMVAGLPIAGQWAEVGMLISARSAAVAGTNTAILFDSGNPTGEDPDLDPRARRRVDLPALERIEDRVP